jgi:hypothetical protein
MKTFIICLGVFLTTIVNAKASEIKILEIPNYLRHYVSVKFNINPELGRAWVETTVSDFNFEDNKTYRTLVKGLSYNAQNEVILLENSLQFIECAEIQTVGRGIFKNQKIQNTNCRFEIRSIEVSMDDGFHIQKVHRTQIFLVAD